MDYIRQKLSNYWTETKAWFKYSETIFLARIQVLSGFVLAGLANVDWSTLSGFVDFKQAMYMSGGLVANGLLTEYLRRRNANL